MKKITIFTIFFILFLGLSNAQTEWTHLYKNYNPDFTVDKGNSVLYNDISYDLGSNDGVTSYLPLIGNIDDDSQSEIVVAYNDGWLIFNVTLSLDYNLTTPSELSHEYNFVLYDFDSDFRDEIISLMRNTSDSNKGVLRIYDYSSGTYSLIKEKKLTQVVNSRPVCYSGYCYFSDTVGNLYKYNPSTNTITSTISVSGNGGVGTLTIQDCNEHVSGLELVSVGDYDGDGTNDDVALVPINNFTSGATNYYSWQLSPDPPQVLALSNHIPVCGDINGTIYMALMFNMFQKSGGVCSFNKLETVQGHYIVYINSSGIAQNITAYGAVTSLNNAFGNPYGISNIIFYDVNSDGKNEYCYGQLLPSGCSGSQVFNHGVICKNSTGSVIWQKNQDILGTMTWGTGVYGSLYVGDFDSDSKDEFIYGGALFHIDTMIHQDISLQDDDQTFISFENFGLECTNYYYTNKDDGRRIYSRVSDVATCDFGESTGISEVLFQESFLTTIWTGLDGTQCSEDSYTSASVLASTDLVLDNIWHCYIDQAGSENVIWDSTSLTSRINTPQGLFTKHQGTIEPNYDTLVTLLNSSNKLDLNQNDEIDFYCDSSLNAVGNYHYLVFADYNLVNEPVVFALEDGGCSYAYDVYENSTNLNCCPISNVTGTDCISGKTHQEFSVQDVINSCPAIGDLDFQDIRRIDIWRNRYNNTDFDYLYFDDLQVIRPAVISNNTLPTILFLDPTPNPAEPNETVTWGSSITDAEEPSSEIYSAFDCDVSDSTLDYNWALRGITLSFYCTYSVESNYTGKIFVSDTAHYPIYNRSDTAQVEITIEDIVLPESSESCVGFVNPNTCTGSCVFTDNFNYDYPIECAGWNDGTVLEYHPISGFFAITPGFSSSEFDFAKDLDNNYISKNNYNSLNIDFDFRLSDDSIFQFSVLDNGLDDYTVFLQFNNYEVIIFDGVSPFTTSLGTLNQDTWHNMDITISFSNEEITYILDGNSSKTATTEYLDTDADSARKFTFSWSSVDPDFDVDDFTITLGTKKTNASVEYIPVDYIYNPELFCGFNSSGSRWTFNIQNCVDRGYNIQGTFGALCIPRACISDIVSATVLYVRRNILTVAILGIIIILIAPLFVMMFKKK